MKSLSPPVHDDEKVIENICNERENWTAHKDKWLQACKNYMDAEGNPWVIKPAVFHPDIGGELKELYNNRRSSGYIEQIRQHPVEGGCPVCGSLGTGTIDHFLPKTLFPEFSIYSQNLVPACSYCNSSQKGSIYRGEGPPIRFIHPYFDKLGDKPILSVAIKEPYKAAAISPIPGPGLVGEELEIVRFHIDVLLGDAFLKYVENLFSKLPGNVLDEIDESINEIDPPLVRAQVQRILKYNQRTYGLNSWPAGFYRGVLADDAVIEFVAHQANADLPQTMNSMLSKSA